MSAEDQLRVEFPASEPFTRIGRVTVVGLALRLGYDVGRVEQLRTAVDHSVQALQGQGQIEARAEWSHDELTIRLLNPDAAVSEPSNLEAELAHFADEAKVTESTIELKLKP